MDEATNDTPSSEYKQRYLDMKAAMNRVENRIDDYNRKQEEERKAKEEAEKKAKEEAEKKAKEEAEKKAKEEAEKKAAAQNATEAAQTAVFRREHGFVIVGIRLFGSNTLQQHIHIDLVLGRQLSQMS